VTEGKERAAILTEASLILAAVFWGLNFAATKYAADYIPPLIIMALRFTGGGILLFLAVWLLEPTSKLRRKDLFPMAALGCFGVATAQTGFTFGVSLTSAASTGLIFATAPVWGLLLGAVLGLERPTRRGILGLALSVVGVSVVVFEGLGAAEDSLTGDLLVLLAAVCVGAYTVLSMPLLERYTPLAVATYPIMFGAPFLLVLSSPYFLNLEWGNVGLGPWSAVGYSAVFATAFAFVGWQTGISRIGANRVLVYQYLITVTGVAQVSSSLVRSSVSRRLWAGRSYSWACIWLGGSENKRAASSTLVCPFRYRLLREADQLLSYSGWAMAPTCS
jgi:drug/metabolite transporter (DMT)-like permease